MFDPEIFIGGTFFSFSSFFLFFFHFRHVFGFFLEDFNKRKSDKSKIVSEFGLYKYIGEEKRVKKNYRKNASGEHKTPKTAFYFAIWSKNFAISRFFRVKLTYIKIFGSKKYFWDAFQWDGISEGISAKAWL